MISALSMPRRYRGPILSTRMVAEALAGQTELPRIEAIVSF
jgi:hypothetical protein